MYVRFQFPLTLCPHKIVTARHVSVPQNKLKMHLPLSMGSLLHKHLPEPLSGFCASKCTKNALIALEGDLTTCKPLVEFYLYPTVSTALVHSVKPKLTE